jgi:hypothetical protein
MSATFILSARVRDKGILKDTRKNETCSLETLINSCTPPFASSHKAETTNANVYPLCKREHHTTLQLGRRRFVVFGKSPGPGRECTRRKWCPSKEVIHVKVLLRCAAEAASPLPCRRGILQLPLVLGLGNSSKSYSSVPAIRGHLSQRGALHR